MDEKFKAPYNPESTEAAITAAWEKSGFYNPDVCIEAGVTEADAPTFSVVLPPPNVTGTLHAGHATMLAIQDIYTRFERMRGKRTLWLPGTDHAAIATQAKVEKELSKKKITRHSLGREAFLKEVEQFASESQHTIKSQVRAMGSSLDWSREAYTLDEKRGHAVFTAFKNMYEAGLIYRGERIVNWDPKGQTTISDDELVYVDQTTPFYYLQYGPFVIGTARPETKFGDKYVVMHPEDSRYQEYEHGQTIELEWINGPISATIIKDEAIDMEFGTGVMTITPWHDATDFEIAERHHLDKEPIIDPYGKLLPIAGEFAGVKIHEAREKIIEKLQAKGLVTKIDEKYANRVATAERSGGIVEPQIMRQWFVDVNKSFTLPHSEIEGIKSGSTTTLKEIMRTTVESGQIKIVPDRFNKTYFHWIDNLHDWCISRQIWYGHRIPVWYQGNELKVSETSPGEGWEQDPDTLDTWFSSGLWTFSTLGWPEKTADLKTYHPTSFLETGYDILFFWVARMVLMTGFHLGTIPFETVYLHGLVRDDKGRKMSKSLGNIIDPRDMIAKYGADALRMALVIATTPGQDTNLTEDKIKAYKKFANKIWNATRFTLEATAEVDVSGAVLNEADNKLLAEGEALAEEVTTLIKDYRFSLAAEKLHNYFWHTFADVIIEEKKAALYGDNLEEKGSAALLMQSLLTLQIKLLHPFMPFITEDIWQRLPSELKHSERLLLVEPWPVITS